MWYKYVWRQHSLRCLRGWARHKIKPTQSLTSCTSLGWPFGFTKALLLMPEVGIIIAPT